MADERPQPDRPELTREQLWSAMQSDADGLRQLQGYLDGIKGLADAEFAEATGGTDRAEAMELLERLNHLLSELDRLTGPLPPDAH